MSPKRTYFEPTKYTYRVIWSQNDSEYVGSCAEFPSLTFLAQKQGEALEGIISVVSDVIGDMLESNEDIPEPITLKRFSGKLMLRITPEKHRELAIEAAEEGISLNRLIAGRL